MPAVLSSDVVLQGLCQAEDQLSAAVAAPRGKGGMTPIKRCEDVNTICPAFCSVHSAIVSFDTCEGDRRRQYFN